MVLKKAWSQAHTNIVPLSQLKSEPCLAVVGGISNHRGWIGHLVRYKSIKGADFLEYLKQVRGDTTEEKVLILDNASIHKTKTNL